MSCDGQREVPSQERVQPHGREELVMFKRAKSNGQGESGLRSKQEQVKLGLVS